MSNGKVMIINLIVGLKKMLLFKRDYFSIKLVPSKLVPSKSDTKVKLDLFNYATESG